MIVKGGLYLERLSSIDTVVLDKTGTLTHGDTEVIAIVSQPGVTEEQLLAVAASVERFSEHPLIWPGRGIHCWVGNVPTLVGSRKFIARIALASTRQFS